MTVPSAPIYFVDENLLGLGKLLSRSGREDVLFPGHAAIPEIPLKCPDLVWMPAVAERQLIVLTRDKRIRTRPAELQVYRAAGVRCVWFGAKRDLRPQDQLELFLGAEARLRDTIVALGDGPWAISLTSAGLRRLNIAVG